MIERYVDYLKEKLKIAGIKTKIFTTMKDLQRFDNPHVAAVIVDKDSFEVNKKNKVYQIEGTTKKRIEKLSRRTMINIIIGDFDTEKCDAVFAKFLSELDKGFYDPNGNYVEMELGEADWVSDKDSILKSTIAVQLPITFYGGIYKDVEYKTFLPDVNMNENEEE